MARKTKPVIIPGPKTEDNRDGDKAFLITEMPADQGDRWAKRALIAVAKVDLDIKVLGDIENLGWQGVATLGMQFLSSLDWRDAEPLLDELMSCVKIITDPTRPAISARAIGLGGAEDIEEIQTISILQAEVFNLHANFSKIFAGLKSKLAVKTPADTSNTQTSRPTSAQSSRRASRP